MHNGAVHVAKWGEKRNEPKRDARTMIMILAMGVLMLHIMTRMWVIVMMITMTEREDDGDGGGDEHSEGECDVDDMKCGDDNYRHADDVGEDGPHDDAADDEDCEDDGGCGSVGCGAGEGEDGHEAWG